MFLFSNTHKLCENAAEIKKLGAEAHILGVLKLLKSIFKFFGEQVSKFI